MPSRLFRHQFIVNARTMSVTGAEILAGNPSSLRFDDAAFMLHHDLAAIRYAGEFAKRTGLRSHCNVEPSTLALGLNRVVKAIQPGIVIELVERYGHSNGPLQPWELADAVRVLKRAGAVIAMDDVTPTDLELELIRRIRPDIIKVENRDALSRVSKVTATRHLIAERVEMEWHANLARLMGVTELQGFWCDEYLRSQDAQPANLMATEG